MNRKVLIYNWFKRGQEFFVKESKIVERNKISIDKRGGSRILSFWLWLNLGLIFVVLVGGIYVFYGRTIDIRGDEAEIISNRLVSAVVYNGYLKKEVLSGDFDIMKEAGLEEGIFDESEMFYFSLVIFENDKVVKNFKKGVKDFEIQCKLEGEHFPECYERELKVLDGYRIKVLSASNQLGGSL